MDIGQEWFTVRKRKYVDDGCRRSAASGAEGRSTVQAGTEGETLRHKDCIRTQLWKAKAPKEQLRRCAGISQVWDREQAL